MSNLNNRNSRYSQKNALEPEILDASRDTVAEELLNNINTTPIGRLLKEIAQLPEVRQEKVAAVRNKLDRNEYNLNERLDLALDRVLEELIT
jgi:hypothetical protein